MTGPLSVLASYLLGSIPTGYLLMRFWRGVDIRSEGSGNIGATNVLRSSGKAAGILTFVLDAGKGAAGVLLARAVAGEPWDAAAALAAVVGHCYPVFLKFKGGKGIATGCGAYGAIAPLPMALALAVFAGVTIATRMVSAGSLAAGVTLPLALAFTSASRELMISALAAVALAVARHGQNIRRIVAGRERRIDQ